METRPHTDDKVYEATIDPRWRVARLGMGPIAVRFEHPRHGVLDFLMPEKDAREMGEALVRLTVLQ